MADTGGTPSRVIFDMELELEEDVDAYLEDFVFFARLGLKRRARQLAENVLWRHIDFFPVFAEICAFYIVCHDRWAVLELITDLAANSIVFSEPDEKDFVRMAALFARGRLRDSATAHDQMKTGPERRGQATPRALESDLLLLHDVNYSSTIQVSPLGPNQKSRVVLTCSFTASEHRATLLGESVRRARGAPRNSLDRTRCQSSQTTGRSELDTRSCRDIPLYMHLSA